MTNPPQPLVTPSSQGLGWTPACFSNTDERSAVSTGALGIPHSPQAAGCCGQAGCKTFQVRFPAESPQHDFKNRSPRGQVTCPRSQPRAGVGPGRGRLMQTASPLGHRQKLCEATSQEKEPIVASFLGSSEHIPDRNRSRADSVPGAKLPPRLDAL